MDKRSFLAGSAASLVLLFSFGAAFAASGGSSNPGIDLYNGTLRMHGNNLANADLVDGVNLSNPGSYLQISGNQYSVDGASIQSGTTASDVGLGNVENVALSNAVWSDLGISRSDVSASDVSLGKVRNVDLANTAGEFLNYDSTNEQYDVNGSAIRSGTTKSDVNLGNTINKEQLAIDGSNSMEANLDMSGREIKSVNGLEDSGNYIYVSGEDFETDQDMHLIADQGIELRADKDGSNGGPFSCKLDESNGNWNCDGTKNWVHDLNSTHTAYYTSQESPQVRAVYEGQVNVTNGRVNVTLPYHFSGTVSEKRPSLRVQATPHSLTTVAVTERSDEWIVIKTSSSEEVTVDYRITGIREGYEDKDVVRPSR